jgi:hypothetical protein
VQRASALSPAWIEEVLETFTQASVPLTELYAALAAALHALGDTRQAMRFVSIVLRVRGASEFSPTGLCFQVL